MTEPSEQSGATDGELPPRWSPRGTMARLLQPLRDLGGGTRREVRYWTHCAECGLTGGPFGWGEGQHLRELHDRIHHRGRPTTAVVLRRPAVRRLADGPRPGAVT